MKHFLNTARLSTWAYLDPKQIRPKLRAAGFRNFAWIENLETDTQCFLCSKGKYVYLTFRGSSTKADWATNFDITLTDCPFGLVHKGFWNDAKSVYFAITQELPRHIIKGRDLVITGHSQGAGVGNATAIKLLKDSRSIEQVITYGGPRIADNECANYLDATYPDLFHRVVNNNDVVTRIAPRLFGYKHFGHFHYFDGEGNYTDDISMWGYFLDRLRYKFDFGGEYGVDIFNDHIPEQYLLLAEKAFGKSQERKIA